ncbi:hypothetical protein GF342_04535 [Candidatus Woesearchaeota archaeon]|nr:hypothetical protein [Candidatus Woesearchaeota archaeon]
MGLKYNWQMLGMHLAQPGYAVLSLVLSLLFFILVYLVTDFDVLHGNLGSVHATIYVVLNLLLAFVFGIYFSLFTKELIGKRWHHSGVTGVVGASAGVMVTGCASCSLTLAALLGLGSFIALLPFSGLEFSILGVALLLYSIKKLTDPKMCATDR